jgi:hypothetical protein
MRTDLKPITFGTFEFNPEASLDVLWSIVNANKGAYAYLVTTVKPVKYGKTHSCIVYIGKARRRPSSYNNYATRGLESFGEALAWICDEKPAPCGRGKGQRDNKMLREQAKAGHLKLRLCLLPCERFGDCAPGELEGALLKVFENLHDGELPKFNCYVPAHPPELEELAEQAIGDL